jgi:hypothetical protein
MRGGGVVRRAGSFSWRNCTNGSNPGGGGGLGQEGGGVRTGAGARGMDRVRGGAFRSMQA